MTRKNPVDLFLGSKLNFIRKKRNLTLEKLSEVVNLSYQQLQKYEAGETKIPTSTLYEICKVLNVEMIEFLDGLDKIQEPVIQENEIVNTHRLSSLKILIIEDNASDERLTREAIEQSEHATEIHHIVDGVEALSFLKNVKKINTIPRPDIIFLDLNLPRKNGIEVLKDIIADSAIKDIPIIILTNSVNYEDLKKVYKYGASGYVVKSFYPDEFYNKINIVIKYWYNMILPSM